jgi:YfiH family protein
VGKAEFRAAAPERLAGTWAWRGGAEAVEVLFTGRTGCTGRDGRGQADDLRGRLARCAPSAPPAAWARQVHSARVLAAAAGECGEGDALVAGAGEGEGEDVALAVVSADCVPVLLAGPQGIAAVHAGWRGLAAGVIPATLAHLSGQAGGLARWCAWVGPAIGPCCYEVGDEVAAQVVAASGPEVARAGPGGRPHLDLQAAARRQLAAAGVGEIAVLPVCTRCRAGWLYSFRREGRGAGRNVAFVWRKPRGVRSNARS